VVTSLVIPLIDFSFLSNGVVYVVQLPEVIFGAQTENISASNNLNYLLLIGTVYFFIAALFLLKFLWDLYLIIRICEQSTIKYKSHFSKNIYINSQQNFSFFSWVFIKESDADKSTVIEHEIGHSQLGHSFDIVFIKVIQIFLWFNPLVFYLEKQLRLQHEYEVDQKVLSKHKNILEYQQLLLNQVFNTEINLVTNNFNQSFLKNRFTMMTKKANKKPNPFLLVVLILAVLITPALISCSMNSSKEEMNEPALNTGVQKSEDVKADEIKEVVKNAVKEDAYVVVEEMPHFPGGEQAMYQYIGNKLEYPEEAKKEGIQGRVFIEFIVEKDGSITNVNVMRGIGHGCDAAIKEVIENMPDWIPGKQRGKSVRVEYRMPIKFTLQ
jgi:TonB family protein